MSLLFNQNTIVNASFPLRQSLNNGETKAYMGMPQKFNVADGGASFAMGRNIFIKSRANIAKASPDNINPPNSFSHSQTVISQAHQISIRNSKPINNTSTDLYIQRKKNNAIGQGSTKPALATTEIISFKNFDKNFKTSALRRARSGGCVAPAKKGAVR